MGNYSSSSTAARTPIPLDESVCWQLYNGTNEQSEPISIFIAKPAFSVECHRSIQFLKTIRHPNIIKFFTGFKTFINDDSFIGDCVHPLANKLYNNDIDSPAKICLGLYQLVQALEFLHEKTSISHNNVCLLSLYISLNNQWKLGNFECASRYDILSKKYLSSLKIIRTEECITPEEDQKNLTELNRQEIYAIDVYGLGKFIRNIMTNVHVNESFNSLLNDLQASLTEEDPQSRPTWPVLLRTQLFQTNYIKAIELLDRLPTVNESDLHTVINSLSTYLDHLDDEYFDESLIRRLLLPFMFMCSSTRLNIIPRSLIPKDDNNNSWISMNQYRTHIIPLIIDLFSYHVTCIRIVLLEYFDSYVWLMSKTTLADIILPQLVYGLKDSNDTICRLTFVALASMVPIIGADSVLGRRRRQIFTDKIKIGNVSFPNVPKIESTTNSSSLESSPSRRSAKMTPISTNKAGSHQLKPTSSIQERSLLSMTSLQYTNEHDLSSDNSLKETPTNVVQNGFFNEQVTGDFDNDDDQWSDWEHKPDLSESSITCSLERSEKLNLSSAIDERPTQMNINAATSKSLKLNNVTKLKWDPNAPLGSEYEISSVALTKKKSTKVETSANEDIEDFFKDMTPKVQTVELMKQLETMFNVNTENPIEQSNSSISTTSFSSKFGIVSQDQDDNQGMDDGTNNWDE